MSFRSTHSSTPPPALVEAPSRTATAEETGLPAQGSRTALMREQHDLQNGLADIRSNRSRLRLGDSGPQVEWLQNKLKQLGFYDGPVNGEFDRGLAQAVRQFQIKNTITKGDGSKVDLLGDGVVGARTMRALDLALGQETLGIRDFESAIGGDWIGYGLGLPEKDSGRRPHQLSAARGAFSGAQGAYIDQYSPRPPGEETPSPELAAAIAQTAWRLGVRKEDLTAVIAFETGGSFRPDSRNPQSGATGLIQFMPQTARELGTSTEELAAMSAVEQMQYVERYLQPFRDRFKSSQDLYAAVLWPRAVGKEDAYPLFSKGSKAYAQNRGLDTDQDGTVTKHEAAQKALKRWG